MAHLIQFMAGSEIFRRHMKNMMYNQEYNHYFITQTIKDTFCLSRNVTEQYIQTKQEILNNCSFFDYIHLVVEFQNNGNLHYHIMGSISKNHKYIKEEGESDFDQILRLYRTRGKNNQTMFSYDTDKKHLDIRVITPSSDFISYLHKDIDKTYKFLGLESKFILSSKYKPLENLHKLVNYKHA